MQDNNPFLSLSESLKPVSTAKALATVSGISEGTLGYWRSMGIGPKFTKVGRSILYSKEDILAYFAQHRVSSTAEAKASK